MRLTVFLIFFLVFTGFAQKPEYAVSLIPDILKENANAVLRYEQIDINITSRSNYTIKTYRVITVLNELGQRSINAAEYHDIKSISAIVYDANGMEIKKIKRKDFREVAIDEGSMISNNRMTYLDYTPIQYPFTVVYESEISDSNTAFIPSWNPVHDLLMGLQKVVFNINCVAGLGFKYKEYNFEGRNVKKEEMPNGLSYTLENIPAIRVETNSPPLDKLVPNTLFGLEKFTLEGFEGDATTWESFGSWYNNLIVGTDELSIETQNKIKALVGDEQDPMKKAKIVYNYVQSKTRYVNISLGIGGWKPMKAKDVDRLGYGDCKGLSNYTKSLLHVVGVPSYHVLVYGSREKLDIRPDFVSMQGNHMILAIPNGNKLTWLECTSQTKPFGFQGEGTDDRLCLLIKPTGGELVRTNIYDTGDNTQVSKGNYTINASGSLSGHVEIRSKGTQYETKSTLESKSKEDLTKFYKEYFSINNLKFSNLNVVNDKDKVEFTETIALDAERYANADNNRLIFAVNAYNQYSKIPQRYRSRSNPFEISRGFVDVDEITIAIPDGFSVEAKPNDIELTDKFGAYKAEFVIVNPKQIVYKRSLKINSGNYDQKEYENYRKFREQIAKADNSKMVLVKS